MPSDRSIIARTYEVFNARDFDAFSELLAEDVEFVMAGVTLRGVPAVTDFIALTVQDRPDLRIEPGRVFQEAQGTVVTEVRILDTDSAALPDGRRVEAWACDLFRRRTSPRPAQRLSGSARPRTEQHEMIAVPFSVPSDSDPFISRAA